MASSRPGSISQPLRPPQQPQSLREDAIAEMMLHDDDDALDDVLNALDNGALSSPPHRRRTRNGSGDNEDDDEDEDYPTNTNSPNGGDSDEVFRDALTEGRLQDITGCDDLDLVTNLELKVDCTKSSLHILGELMPSLQTLRLSHSNIPSLRDLGTRLTRLRVCWINRSGVEDLTGLHFCHQLTELYAAFNNVKTLAALSGLFNLEVIDLEGNMVSHFREVETLRGLTELTSFSLSGNPVVAMMGDEEYRKRAVAVFTDNLRTVDELPVTPEDRTLKEEEDRLALAEEEAAAQAQAQSQDPTRNANTPPKKEREALPPKPQFAPPRPSSAAARRSAQQSHLDPTMTAELSILQQAIKAHKGMGMSAMVESEHRGLVSRQLTSSSASVRTRPFSGLRSGEGGGGGNPNTASKRTSANPASAPADLGSPSKAPTRGPSAIVDEDEPYVRSVRSAQTSHQGQGATAGEVLAGNITRSLRAKKGALQGSQSSGSFVVASASAGLVPLDAGDDSSSMGDKSLSTGSGCNNGPNTGADRGSRGVLAKSENVFSGSFRRTTPPKGTPPGTAQQQQQQQQQQQRLLNPEVLYDDDDDGDGIYEDKGSADNSDDDFNGEDDIVIPKVLLRGDSSEKRGKRTPAEEASDRENEEAASTAASRDADFSRRLQELKLKHLGGGLGGGTSESKSARHVPSASTNSSNNDDSEQLRRTDSGALPDNAEKRRLVMSEQEVLSAVLCYKQSVSRQIQSDLELQAGGGQKSEFESLDLKSKEFHDVGDVL